MSLNEIIAQAIDCPMMDCKNVADIIAGYYKYNIIQDCEVKNVIFDINDPNDNYDDQMMYLYDGEYFYVLETPQVITFEKGEPGNFSVERTITGRSPLTYTEERKFHTHCSAKEYSKYLFVECSFCIKAWRIVKRYNSYGPFYDAYFREVCKWAMIADREELLDYRRILIRFNGSIVFRGRDEDDETIEFTTEKKYDILNLWDDWELYRYS